MKAHKDHHLLLLSVHNSEKYTMRTTLALDDELIAKAEALTGLSEKAALVREALRALIQRETAKRMALLVGSQPDLTDTPRRAPQLA